MWQGEAFEIHDVVLLRQVDESKIIDGNYPVSLGWVWVTEKNETGGKGLRFGAATGIHINEEVVFTNREVQRNAGNHNGKADPSFSEKMQNAGRTKLKF